MPLTSGNFLQFIKRPSIQPFQYTRTPCSLFLLCSTGDLCSASVIRCDLPASTEQLVWEMAVEDNARSGDPPKHGDAYRKLIDDEDIKAVEWRQRRDLRYPERQIDREDEEEREVKLA